ncbi:MAG: hypothetical protein ABIU06_20745 [Anaerolineales bacterium]
MSTERIKFIMPICLCVSVLFSTLACALVNNVGGGNSLAPVRTLTLTVDTSQREEFISQLQIFSEKHGFETEIDYYNIKGEHFQFWMLREDIKITVGSVPPDPTLVYIAFYAGYPGAPADEDAVDEVDELVTDLISFISEIPNVTITEEK